MTRGACQIWKGATSNGYPVLLVDGRYHKVRRLVYEQHRGPIPKGACIKTACGKRGCVAPEHLRLRKQIAASGRKRLLPQTIRAIRRYARRGHSYHTIAQRFGVSEVYVGKLVRGKARTDVRGR